MAMNFEELDATTRSEMLKEFDAEQLSGNAYYSKGLSAAGLVAFPKLMRDAIQSGNEVSLGQALKNDTYWNSHEQYERDGAIQTRKINVSQASDRLAGTEFNTWYVRGFARRLLSEGVTKCQAYRAAQPKWEQSECSEHEGQIFDVATLYKGHRAKYWPPPGNPDATSIPFGPSCHHTIRRYP